MSESQSARSGVEPNRRIADLFDEMADLLEARHANDFRIRAYRRGADVLRDLLTSVVAILADSRRSGLEEIPGIGKSLAFAIERYVETGCIPMLKQLRDADTPKHRFESVPDVGPKLAARNQGQLHIENLGELQAAAIDGRLARVPGIGPGRAQAVRDSIAGRGVRRVVPQRTLRDADHHDEPPVAELLSVDAEYRERAAEDSLPRIVPTQFNPTGEAWLPVLHTHREARHFTAMYSNTAHAHELEMTHDWVIIRRTDHSHHQQWTVITSQLGALKGRRIVRGRENECRAFYHEHPWRVDSTERFLAPDEPRQLLLFDSQPACADWSSTNRQVQVDDERNPFLEKEVS